MSAATAAPSDATNTRLERDGAMLDRLAQLGMEIAEAIHALAVDPETPAAVLSQAGLDFARVSRAVRMTLFLRQRLEAQAAAPVADAAGDDPDPIPYEIYWGDGEPLTRSAKRRVLTETVREAAAERGLERETVERLETEAVERSEREDLFPSYPKPGNMPFGAMVARICEDLGLSPHQGPLPLDGGVREFGEGELSNLRSGGDGSDVQTPTGRPHPRSDFCIRQNSSRPHQGGREPAAAFQSSA